MIIGMGKESLRMLMEESMMEMIIGIYTYVVDNVYDGEWKDVEPLRIQMFLR